MNDVKFSTLDILYIINLLKTIRAVESGAHQGWLNKNILFNTIYTVAKNYYIIYINNNKWGVKYEFRSLQE